MILQIRNLNIRTTIGVSEVERLNTQDLIICLNITIPDTSTVSDNISNTVDYDELCKKIKDFALSNTCKLIEYLAKQIASIVLEYEDVLSVTVEVHKQANEEYRAVAIYNESRNLP